MKAEQSGIDVLSEAIRQKDEEIERLKRERKATMVVLIEAEQRLKELEEALRVAKDRINGHGGVLEALSSEGEGK